MPWGDATMTEPPDEQYLCRRCAIAEAIEDAGRILRGGRSLDHAWRPGWNQRLGWAIARGMRKHGLGVAAHPESEAQ